MIRNNTRTNSRGIRMNIKRKPKISSFAVKNKMKNEMMAIDNSFDEAEIVSSQKYKNFENNKPFKSGHNYKATEESIEYTRKRYPGLVMLQDRDPEEAKAIRRKGAYAAQEARKRNMKLKEVLATILSCNATLTTEQRKIAVQYGIISTKTKKLNNSFLMMLILFKRAMQGNLQAIEKIQDIIGENPWLEKYADKNDVGSELNINFYEGDIK